MSDQSYFLPYQWTWIDDGAPMKLYRKSRRIGITYATSYRCVRKCMQQSGMLQWVSSRDMQTAQEFVTDYVRYWVKLLNLTAKGLEGDDIMLIDPQRDVRAFQVTFPAKPGQVPSRLISLSSNPYAFAGKGGDILLDELDLHDDAGTLLDMAIPCTTWGGQLEVVSAFDPDGSPDTVFAQLIHQAEAGGNPMRWSLHSTTLDDAIGQGFVEKVNEVAARKGRAPQTRDSFRADCRAKCRTQAAFDSQYLCIPNQSAGQHAVTLADLQAGSEDYPIVRLHLDGDATASDLVDPCVRRALDELRPFADCDRTARWALGYDVARTGDLASIWLMRQDGARWRLEVLITCLRTKFASQRELIRTAMRHLPWCVAAGDATGLGMDTCETLASDFPGRFEGLNFSTWKRDLGTVLTGWFEDHRMIVPLDPPEIAADLRTIKRDALGRYVELANELNEHSHADMAWSCALAIHAADSQANLLAEGCSVDVRAPAGAGSRDERDEDRLVSSWQEVW